MQVKNLNIEDVKPYERNPRKNDDAVEYVANSIKEFGFQQPLVVDKDGVLIVGHTRLKAAEKLGLKEVPVVVADNLTDEQAKAYRLADNKTGEMASWDWEALNLELEDIDWLDINMEEFGFKLQGIYGLSDEFSLDTGEEPNYRTMTLHFDNPTYEYVCGVLDSVETENGSTYSDKVYEVCKQWAKR